MTNTVVVRRFQFAGVQMKSPARHNLYEEYGHISMDFEVLVDEIVDDELLGEPFVVGSVSVCRINVRGLDLSDSPFWGASSVTPGTHQWGSCIAEDHTEVWQRVFKQNDVLGKIEDFIGIDDVYIDAQFRSNGLFEHALRDIAGVIGYGESSCMMVVSCPWAHLGGDKDFYSEQYHNAMTSLGMFYERVGFTFLREWGVSLIMAMPAMFENNAWSRVCAMRPEPFDVKNFSQSALIVDVDESIKRTTPSSPD